MTLKVVHAWEMPDLNLWEEVLAPLDVAFHKGFWLLEDELIENAGDADALIAVPSFHPLNRRVLEALKKCRIIAGIAIGFEKVDLEAATEQCIVVTNVPDYCLDEVSGIAITFMLALGNRLSQVDKAVREGQVSFPTDRKALLEVVAPRFRMRNQTVGIIGLGKIGSTTALKAKGLGMRVIAYDPYVPEGVIESRGAIPVDLDTLLRESDFISLHTPRTEETYQMMGSEEFRKMKTTAFFINTARGECVKQAALIQALREGWIAGAGLDVTEDEPIEKDNPLREMTNVFLTGHSAYYSEVAEKELFLKPVKQALKALQGEWPSYVLNPEVKDRWREKWSKPA